MIAALALLPAVAQADTFFISSANNNTVSKVAEDGTVSVFASGLKYPEGLALDSDGNLYVANRNGGTVSRISPAGAVSTFSTVANASGLAFDAGGNLYAAQFNQNTIVKISPAGVVTPFASGLNGPIGLAFDAGGNLYAANLLGATVSKVTPAGSVTSYADTPPDPFALVFDKAGNLLVSDLDESIFSITPSGQVSTFATVTSGSGPSGMTFGSDGNLYVAAANTHAFSHDPAIFRITPEGVVSTFRDNFPQEFSFSQFIIAQPVPEPSAAYVLGAAAAALTLARARRAGP